MTNADWQLGQDKEEGEQEEEAHIKILAIKVALLPKMKLQLDPTITIPYTKYLGTLAALLIR